MVQQPLDPGQLLLFERVGRLLPRLGPLERDALRGEDLTEPFPPDADPPTLPRPQVVGELADRPVRERAPQLGGPGLGRLDDELTVSRRDLAGTATRPLRVQRSHPQIVEPVDHLANPVRRRLHQPGDRRHVVPARRRQHHHRSSPLHDRPVGLAAPTNDPLQLSTFRVVQATHTHTFCHPPIKTAPTNEVVDATLQPVWSEH